MNRHLRSAFALAALLPALSHALAQSARAIPHLDLNKLTGTWYEIQKLPNKAERRCISDETVLYALSDKPDTFQMATVCVIRHGVRDDISNSGRVGKQHDGKLRVRKWFILHRPLWVLDADPDFRWAMFGSPNHKEFWIVARTLTLPSELVGSLRDKAAQQGYKVDNLVTVQHPADRAILASPSANPNAIEGNDPTKATKEQLQPTATAHPMP